MVEQRLHGSPKVSLKPPKFSNCSNNNCIVNAELTTIWPTGRYAGCPNRGCHSSDLSSRLVSYTSIRPIWCVSSCNPLCSYALYRISDQYFNRLCLSIFALADTCILGSLAQLDAFMCFVEAAIQIG